MSLIPSRWTGNPPTPPLPPTRNERFLRRQERRLAELLTRAGEGDQQAFQELFALTSPHLYALIHHQIPSEPRSAEVVVEAYVSIWRRSPTYGGCGSAFTWIAKIALTAARDAAEDADRDGVLP